MKCNQFFEFVIKYFTKIYGVLSMKQLLFLKQGGSHLRLHPFPLLVKPLLVHILLLFLYKCTYFMGHKTAFYLNFKILLIFLGYSNSAAHQKVGL